jgi:hypothetical protein
MSDANPKILGLPDWDPTTLREELVDPETTCTPASKRDVCQIEVSNVDL